VIYNLIILYYNPLCVHPGEAEVYFFCFFCLKQMKGMFIASLKFLLTRW
jgi:hypothetical protein